MTRKKSTGKILGENNDKPKKRIKPIRKGDFVQNVEDETLILVVTKTPEKQAESFHATVINPNKQYVVGEHDRFWLKNRFKQIKIDITIKE